MVIYPHLPVASMNVILVVILTVVQVCMNLKVLKDQKASRKVVLQIILLQVGKMLNFINWINKHLSDGKKEKINAGPIEFSWKLTAQHKTESWDYYITKKGWDNTKPLTRNDFELSPFCHYNGNGVTPPSIVIHNCKIPADRVGYHVILGVWSIADTGNAFYQAIDVNVK